jgi:enoyl-CoA hydratase/carnithine racemase
MGATYEKKDMIAILTINRPEAMNTIDQPTFREMKAAVEDFRIDDATRVLIVTGAGEKAFSTGADLKSVMSDVNVDSAEWTRSRWFEGVYKPVIAAVNGYCFAGAMEIVLFTDIRIASENAVFGMTEAKWGVSPCDGAITRLTSQVSWCHMMELFAIADPISAQDALRMGLVNKVVPLKDLMPTAEKIARRMAENAPLALRNIKEVALRSLSMPMEQAFALEWAMGSRIMTTEDAKEGPRAFAEKRKPNYKGR